MRYSLFPLGALLVWSAAAAPPRGSITINRIAAIKYPTKPAWSPDGKTIAFLWDEAGRQNLYAVRPNEKPVALTDFPADPDTLLSDITDFEWASPEQVLFGKEGQLYSVSLSSRQPVRVRGLEGAGGFALSSDRTQIVFVRQGQVWVASLSTKSPRLLVPAAGAFSSDSSLFSPDGNYVAFTMARGGLEPEQLKFNGELVKTFRNVTWESRLGVVSVYGGNPVWIPYASERRGSPIQWTADGSVLYQELSPDRKTRSIKSANMSGAVRTLWSDHDDAWWSPTGGARTVVSPDGKLVAFFSDRSGWIHLYVMPSDARSESAARQLTTGKFTDGYASWSPDSKRIAYSHSVEGNQMELFLSIVDVEGGKSEPVVTARGVNFDPVFHPAAENWPTRGPLWNTRWNSSRRRPGRAAKPRV